MINYRIVLLSGLVGLAGACSATSYREPVSEFAAATGEAATAMSALDRQITASYEERLEAQILSGNRLVITRSGDCELVGSERCRLLTIPSSPDEPEVLYPPDPVLGNIVILMGQIDTYSKGLAEIVNADTATKVAAHVNSTLGSVENLAKTVDKMSGSTTAATLASYKTPVGKAVNWIVGNYIAKVQVDGLRAATGAADPVIQEATFIFQGAADIASPIASVDPQERFEAARRKFEDDIQAGRDGAMKGNLAALVAAANAYDRILVAKPSSVYARFGEAHAALTDSLHDKDVTLATVAARIETLVAEAKALAEIVRDFSEVRPN